MIPIDKNMPIPPRAQRKYPWGEMEIGDSFFVKGRNVKDFHAQIYMAGRRFKRKFALRKTDEGIRVWRIE